MTRGLDALNSYMNSPFDGKPKKTFELTEQEAESQGMFDLSDEELEQTTGGHGRHHYRRWHREYRRDHHGREIIIIVVEEY